VSLVLRPRFFIGLSACSGDSSEPHSRPRRAQDVIIAIFFYIFWLALFESREFYQRHAAWRDMLPLGCEFSVAPSETTLAKRFFTMSSVGKLTKLCTIAF
jgi:hypothetical protein